MVMFKIHRDNYGIHLQIKLLKINFQAKVNKEYELAHTIGVRNNTGGFRLIFLDYDETMLEFIKDEIKHLQARFFLSDFYIFKSSQKPNGFHAICLDKLRYKEFLEAMSYTSCDEYYKTMPPSNDKNSWVLRMDKKEGSEKPKPITTIKSKWNIRKKSLAHALFLKYNYKITINKLKNLDKNKKLYVIKYGTLNYIQAKDIKQTKNKER